MAHIQLPTYEQMKKKIQKLEKEALRRKLADEVLCKSEERYRMIFNYSPLVIVHFDSTGAIVDCNEIAEKHGGSVWVELGARNGITFYISISKYL